MNKLLIAVIALSLTSCSLFKDEVKKPQGKTAYSHGLFIGWGRVWTWHFLDPEALASALQRNKLNLTIVELGGDFDDVYFNTSLEKLPAFLAAMKKHNIWTEVVISNSNAPGITKSEAWYRGYIDKVHAITEASGAHVLINPITEPGNFKDGNRASIRKMENIIEYAYSKWPSNIMIAEQRREPYRKFLSRAAIQEYHHCRYPDSRTMQTGVMNSFDCSPLLNPAPETLYEQTKLAIKKKAHLIIYRGHKTDASIEEARMAYMKRAIEES
jgi:hypothetical protein